MSAAVPVLVTLIGSDFVWPSTTLPKLKLEGDAVKPAWAPVPLTLIFAGEFAASLTIVIDPVMLPRLVGANETVSATFCDGLIVVGVGTPLVVKPAPAEVTLEIFAAAFPVFVKMICFSADVPVATVPKLRLAVFAVNWPVVAVVPLPLRETPIVGFVGSLLVMLRVPVALPAAVGEKLTTA